MQVDESTLDNILMAQKDGLLFILNQALKSDGEHGETLDYFYSAQHRIDKVLDLLEFNLRLWNTANYGYKGREIIDRLKRALRNFKAGLHHAASLKLAAVLKWEARCDELWERFTTHSTPAEVA